MVRQARVLAQATSDLVNAMRSDAEAEVDVDNSKKLLAAAKLLADATARMVEAAKVRIIFIKWWMDWFLVLVFSRLEQSKHFILHTALFFASKCFPSNNHSAIKGSVATQGSSSCPFSMQSGAARYQTSNLPILLRLKFQKHACLSFLEFGFDTYSVPKKTELS